MNKKGFVFMETLVVLVVLIIGITSLYAVYIRLSANIERRKYFDNVSDLYKTDLIRSKFINTEFTGTDMVTINSLNCSAYMEEGCSELLTNLNVNSVYITLTSIRNILNSNVSYNNSFVEYLRTMNSNVNKRYIIVNFVYNNINYYASLRI